MILDKENMLSYKQAITVTAVGESVIDLGPNHWAGASGSDKNIPLMIAIDTPFADSGSDATLKVEIQSSNSENMASPKTHYSRTFAFAELLQIGNLDHGLALPPDVRRYVRANYTVASGPFTAGKITIGVTPSRQTNL